MAAIFRTLGEAIATYIDANYAGTKADEVDAVMGWRIYKSVEDLDTLDVGILRRQQTSIRADRATWYDTYIYDITIRKRFDVLTAESTEIEPYEDLTTELRDFLRPLSYTVASTTWDTESCDIAVAYSPKAFDEQHVYMAVLSLFMVAR